MIRKVLIAVSDDTPALNAAKQGIKLAEQLNASAGIIYVVEESVGSIDAGLLPVDIENLGISKAKAFINEIRTCFKTIPIEEFIPIGVPHKEIQKLISLWEPDLLVIGQETHHFFSASIEKSLRHHLQIPILIIPGHVS
jgi:nucleotide-binding universal stress UspA family protein